jgi:hypothetical protein
LINSTNYYWKVICIDQDSALTKCERNFKFTTSSTATRISEQILGSTPVEFYVFQNHPNPFNTWTTIRYQIPEQSHVTMEVLNLLGQRLRTLVDEGKDKGYFAARWDGRDDYGREVTSGVYVGRIEVSNGENDLFFSTIKMIILR